MKMKKTSLTEIFSGSYKVLSDEGKVLFYLNDDKNITKVNSKNMNGYFIQTDNGELLGSKIDFENNDIFTILHRDTKTKKEFTASFEILEKDGDLVLLPKKLEFVSGYMYKINFFLDLNLDMHDIKIINNERDNIHISYKDKEENFIEIKYDGYKIEKYINGELKEVNSRNQKIEYSSFDFEGQECKSELITTTDNGNVIKRTNEVKNAKTNELVYTSVLTKNHLGDTEEVRKTISGNEIKDEILINGFLKSTKIENLLTGEVVEIKVSKNGNEKEIKTTNGENKLIEKYVKDQRVYLLKRSGNIKDGVEEIEEEINGTQKIITKTLKKERIEDIENSNNAKRYIYSENKNIEVFDNDKLISKESVIPNDKGTVTTRENLLTGEKSVENKEFLLDENRKIIGKDIKTESFLHGELVVREHLEEIHGKKRKETIEKFDSDGELYSKVIEDTLLITDVDPIKGKPTISPREVTTITKYDGKGNIVKTYSEEAPDKLRAFLFNTINEGKQVNKRKQDPNYIIPKK